MSSAGNSDTIPKGTDYREVYVDITDYVGSSSTTLTVKYGADAAESSTDLVLVSSEGGTARFLIGLQMNRVVAGDTIVVTMMDSVAKALTLTVTNEEEKVTCPVVSYGGNFDIIDLKYSSAVGRDVNILDRATEILLENNPDMKFIRWEIRSEGDVSIPIYNDTTIDERIIDITAVSNTYKGVTYDSKVLVLSAVTSEIAVEIHMEPGTDDVTAVVAAPSTFLIYPNDDVVTVGDTYQYTFTYRLNDATRTGYYLDYWQNTEVTSGSLQPAPGLERTMMLVAKEDGSGHLRVIGEYLLVDGEDPIEIRTYTEGGTWVRLDDASDPYTISYTAYWAQIDYTVSINNTAHGVVDAYKIVLLDNGQTTTVRGSTFTAHYGDRIKLVFTPDERYHFFRWTHTGECIIEDQYSSSTTMVVTGDSVIQVSDIGERVVRVYMSLNGEGVGTSSIFLRDESGSYKEIVKNDHSDSEGMALYVDYALSGTYVVCLRSGTTYYELGSIEVGAGQNMFNFEAYSVVIDITDEETSDPVTVGHGITSYSAYAGRPMGSGQAVYASITVSGGYKYDLSENYYDSNEVLHEIQVIGSDDVGLDEDRELLFDLDVELIQYERVIVGTVTPKTYTVNFFIGDGTDGVGQIPWKNSDEEHTFVESLSPQTVRYGEVITYDGTGRLPIASDVEQTSGSESLASFGYSIFHWYTDYSAGQFSNAVLDGTVLDNDLLAMLKTGQLVNNTFTMYPQIIYEAAGAKLSVVVTLQNTDGDNYTNISDLTIIPIISSTPSGFKAMFTIPSQDGFEYSDFVASNVLSGSTLTHVGNDYTFNFTPSGANPTVEIQMDRLTAVVRLIPGYSTTIAGWEDDSGGGFTKELRYGQSVVLPTLERTYYTFNGWYDDSEEGVTSYTATLQDVQAHASSPSSRVTLHASFTATTTITITYVTPVGQFENGEQRYSVTYTPDETPQIPMPTSDDLSYSLINDYNPYSPQVPNDLTDVERDLTVTAQWFIVPHSLTLTIDSTDNYLSVSGSRDSSALFSVETTLNKTYSHHSEIILTIRPVTGYDLDLSKTTVVSAKSIGEPEELDGGLGYRWAFFLDNDVSITFHSKRATLDVYYFVNGSLMDAWTQNVEKYDTATLHEFDLEGYTSTSGWFTDESCTEPYSSTTCKVLSEMRFYTLATPNKYYMWYHPNNGSADSVTPSEVDASIAAHRADAEVSLLPCLQEFTYGVSGNFKTFTNDASYNISGYTMLGWTVNAGSGAEGNELRYRNGGTVINLASTDGAIIQLYGYYVTVSENSTYADHIYNGTGYGCHISKSTGYEGKDNMHVYYSTTVLSSVNYESGSETAPEFIDAGTYDTFYYGWVQTVDSGGNITSERAVFSGKITTTIDKRPVTFTSASGSRGYIADVPYTNNNILPEGMASVLESERAGLSFDFTLTPPVAVGSYNNTFDVIFDGVRIKSTNYEVTKVYGTLTITSSSGNISVNSEFHCTYGDSSFNLYAVPVDVSDTLSYSTSDTIITVDGDGYVTILGAGKATVRVYLTGDSTKFVDVSVDIDKKGIAVTTTISNSSRMYDGTVDLSDSQVLTASPDGILAGDVGNVTVTPHGTYSGLNAGSQTISLEYDLTGTKSGNYRIAEGSTTSIAGTINPRDVTVTSDSATKAFDNTPLTKNSYTISGSGFVMNEGLLSVSIVGTRNDAGSSDNDFELDEGDNVVYELKYNTTASNYTITFVEGTLTVTPITVAIPVGGSLDYDGYSHAAAVPSSPWYEFTDGITSATAVGTYTVTVSLKYNHDSAANVKWSDDSTTSKNVTWAIGKSQLDGSRFALTALSIVYDHEAHDDVVVYEPPAEGSHYTEGVDYRIEYCSDVTNVGVKTVQVIGIGGYSGGDPIEFTFTIVKRPVIVTVQQGQAFVYDGQVHSPTYTQLGLISDDDVSLEMSVKDQVNYSSGGYSSTIDITGSSASNYSFDPVVVNWTIEKRIAYVIAQSAWKPYDAAELTSEVFKTIGILAEDLPGFTITISGSQTASGASVNTVTCTTDDETLGNNYAINLIYGSLIVSNSVNDISYITTTVDVTR